VQAHTLGEAGILGTVLLRVSSGTILRIFIEIGSYLTDKEQKNKFAQFFETLCRQPVKQEAGFFRCPLQWHWCIRGSVACQLREPALSMELGKRCMFFKFIIIVIIRRLRGRRP